MSLTPFVHIDASLDGARSGEAIALTSEEAHHLSTVLRLAKGAPVEVSDGAGGWAEAELDGRTLRLQTDATSQAPDEPHLVVAQALPKGRRLDEVIRQVTELGVSELVPVVAERCVVRLAGLKADRATARWSAVARAACEQSRRVHRPHIAPITTVAELAPAAAPATTRVLVAQPGAEGLPQQLDACRGAERVIVVIGPEGGFTDAELALLSTAGARRVGLVPTTLRAEHAAPAAVAVLAAALGRWG